MKYWLFVLMLLPGVASASAFKCMDENGRVAYANRPCEANPGLVPWVNNSDVAEGTLIVHRGAEQDYRTTGSVNGSPVTFVVDPGVARSAISQDVAAAAGLEACPHGKACSVRVHEISFGDFELNNVMISITPDLPVAARLGKNVLKRLKVRQSNGALYISSR